MALIMSGFARRSKRSRASSKFNRVNSHPTGDPYLESHILGSVKGGGKFMESGVHPQRQWLGHTAVSQQSQGASTVREEFED